MCYLIILFYFIIYRKVSNNTIEMQFPGCPPSYHAALSEVLTDSFDELEDYSGK